MLMHRRHVSVLVCTISILWTFHTNPYHPSETTSGNNSVTVPVKPQERQITSCRARGGQHARPSHKHRKACAKHAHAPPPRFCACLHDFHLVEFSHQPVPVQLNNELKQQGDGAGETSRTTNYELHGTGWATRAPVVQTLQSVRQTCLCTTATCLYLFARFPSCGIFTPTRTSPVKQRVETTV